MMSRQREMEVLETWLSDDVRDGRDEKWVNILLKKKEKRH